VDEVANEVNTWPGVHIERLSPSVTVARYEQLDLGTFDTDRGVVEVRFTPAEVEDLVEHGNVEPPAPSEPELVSHELHGPADVTAALELLDRRYRDLRGEDDPYTSEDPPA
jgi:hypothetical protein